MGQTFVTSQWRPPCSWRALHCAAVCSAEAIRPSALRLGTPDDDTTRQSHLKRRLSRGVGWGSGDFGIRDCPTFFDMFWYGKGLFCVLTLHIELHSEIYIFPVEFWQTLDSKNCSPPHPLVMSHCQTPFHFLSHIWTSSQT